MVSFITGVAMNKEEYVPTKIPTQIANTNPRIVSPPKMKIANNTTKVVAEVLIVLLNVEFNALLTNPLKSLDEL